MARTFTGQYWVSAKATVGIYAKKGGVWNKITNVPVTVSGTYSSSAAQTLVWTIDQSFQLGTGVQMFGATIEAVVGYSGTTAAVTDIASVSWQVLNATGGESSATPDGQRTTVTVRPQ